MSIADELRKEGRKEGIEKLTDIITKLRNKFGNVSIELIDEVKKQNALNQLDDIDKAIEKADSLEELKGLIS